MAAAASHPMASPPARSPPAEGMELVNRSPGGGRKDAKDASAAADLAITVDKGDFEDKLTGGHLPSHAVGGDDAHPAEGGPLTVRSWWHDGFHTEDPNFVMTQRFHWGYFLRELVFQGLGVLAVPIVLAWDGKNAAYNRALIPVPTVFLYNYFSVQGVLMTFGCAAAVLVFFIAGEDDLPTMYASEFVWSFLCFMLRGVVISTKYGFFSDHYRNRLKTEVIEENVFGSTMLFPAWGAPTPEMIDYRLRESTYRLGLDPRLLKFHIPAHVYRDGGVSNIPQAGPVRLDRDVSLGEGAAAVDAAPAASRLGAKAVAPYPVQVGASSSPPPSAHELLHLKHGPLPTLLRMAPCGCCLCHSEEEAVQAARPDIEYVEVDAMREANLIAQSAFHKTLPALVPFVTVGAIFMGFIPSFVRVHEGKPFFGAGGLDTLGIVGVYAATTIMLTGIWGWAVISLLDMWRRVVALRMHSELGASIALFNLPPTRPRVDSSWLHWFTRFTPSVDFPRWASFSSTCPQNVQTWLHVRRILLDTGGHFAFRTHVYVGYYVVICLGVVGYVLFRVARGESTDGLAAGEAAVVIAPIDLALSGLVLGVLSVTMVPTLVLGWYANESLRQRDVAMLIGHKFGAQVRLRNSRTPYDAHGEMNDTIDSVVEVLEHDRSMRPGKILGVVVTAAVVSSIGSAVFTGLVVVGQLVTGFTCWGLCGST